MRALAILLLLAACDPDIAPGAYMCGPEEACPDGLACNRPDNLCVAPTAVKPFACGAANEEIPGDDAPATAQNLGELACISLVRGTRGCLPAGDVGDFYSFRVADGCTNVKVQASVVFPIAFESLALQLAKAGEAPVAITSACAANRATDEGEIVRCLEAPVDPGTYALGVVPDGTGDCDRACAFNRYGFAVQVTGR
jgi:hypothetical protein